MVAASFVDGILCFGISLAFCIDKSANMNSSLVYKIETAILKNTEIIKLCGDSKCCSHASVSDNCGKYNFIACDLRRNRFVTGFAFFGLIQSICRIRFKPTNRF